MGMNRKNNPRFRLGKNVLGGNSWRVKPGVGNVDVAGLRAGLTDGPATAKFLPRQKRPTDIRQEHHEVQIRGDVAYSYAIRERDHRFTDDMTTKAFVGAWGGISAGAFVAIGAPFVAVPFVAVAGGVFAASWVRPRIARWKARRKARKGFERGPSRRQYRQEAKRVAAAFPHFSGGVTPSKSPPQEYVDTYKMRYMFASKVDGGGVAEVKWEEQTNPERASGSYFLYPYVSMEETYISYPVNLPGVNLQGANLGGTVLAPGSVLDGADLRDTNLRKCEWGSISLRGVNMSGADVTGAHLPEDLTGTNITREQFESLAPIRNSEEGARYRVKEVSMDELAAAFGGDRDSVAVMVWAGDVEVRERATNEVVASGFDIDKHYVPHWGLANINGIR